MTSSSTRQSNGCLALTGLLLLAVSSSNAFQLRPSGSTTQTTLGPYQHCYFSSNSNNNHKICAPLQPTTSSSSNNNNNKREVSLYVSLMPPQEDESDFFFRAPFPAEIPVVPSELTSKRNWRQLTTSFIRSFPPILGLSDSPGLRRTVQRDVCPSISSMFSFRELVSQRRATLSMSCQSWSTDSVVLLHSTGCHHSHSRPTLVRTNHRHWCR